MSSNDGHKSDDLQIIIHLHTDFYFTQFRQVKVEVNSSILNFSHYNNSLLFIHLQQCTKAGGISAGGAAGGAASGAAGGAAGGAGGSTGSAGGAAGGVGGRSI